MSRTLNLLNFKNVAKLHESVSVVYIHMQAYDQLNIFLKDIIRMNRHGDALNPLDWTTVTMNWLPPVGILLILVSENIFHG